MSQDRKLATPINQTAGGASFGSAAPVTPADSTPLPTAAQALFVGGAGNVALTTINNQSVTFTAVPAGTLLPIACTFVKATGTSATSIVALW
jgi:hypothetical protein